MNPGALVINCARGGLIDETALKAAIDSGHIAGCALDVFEVEPPAADYPLFSLDKHIVFTPHLGASTNEAQENVGIEVAEQLRDFFVTGEIRNAVNMPNLDSRTLESVGPYLDLANSLGKLLSKIAPAQCDAIRVSYLGPVSELDTELITRMTLTGYLAAAHEATGQHRQRTGRRQGPRPRHHGIHRRPRHQLHRAHRGFRHQGRRSLHRGRHLLRQVRPHRAPRRPQRGNQSPGRFLFVENDDRPGIVGIIGTALGTASVNIANMALSRTADRTRPSP